MEKPPLAVRIIAWIYILTGAGGFVQHLLDLKSQPLEIDLVWAELTSLIAIVAGVYLLRGHDWARWLALAWMAFHVVLSIFHTRFELAMHALFFLLLTYFLFQPAINRFVGTARGSSSRY